MASIVRWLPRDRMIVTGDLNDAPWSFGLREMERLVRPGGLLLVTTQGVGSLAYYLRGGYIDEPYAVRATEDLLATGHHYLEAFPGDVGDWGVKSAEWGMAYMTLDWLAAAALPQWSIELFEPVRIDGNQDLVVLRMLDVEG